MAANEILSQRLGQSLILTFNRPEHGNAFTFDMANQLHLLLKNATTDRSIRAVMLCGAGNNFMDGLDGSFYVGDVTSLQERSNQLILPYHSAIREIQAMDKPVLAAVEGAVAGPGLSLMLAADIVIASRHTQFNCRSTQFAISPDGGCSYFLPRKVGASRALELLMLCEDFGIEEAEKINLVNRVVDSEALQEEALAFLDRLASGPTRAYGAIRKLIMQSFDHDLNGQLGLEHTYIGQCARSFDFHEVVKAYAARRPPKFTGT